MLYDLNNPLDTRRFVERVTYLIKKGARIELTEKTQRSLSQNNYLHLILTLFAMETGNTVEYVKEYIYKRACNKELYLRRKNDAFLGDIEVLRSSSDLSVEEMTESINRFRNWASSEAGIYLPSADEREMLQIIETQAKRYNQYL